MIKADAMGIIAPQLFNHTLTFFIVGYRQIRHGCLFLGQGIGVVRSLPAVTSSSKADEFRLRL